LLTFETAPLLCAYPVHVNAMYKGKISVIIKIMLCTQRIHTDRDVTANRSNIMTKTKKKRKHAFR
jgi:hypothetical protein